MVVRVLWEKERRVVPEPEPADDEGAVESRDHDVAVAGRAGPVDDEDVAVVTERQATDARELKRSLFVQKGLLTAAEAGKVLGGVSAETMMEYVRGEGLPCLRPGKRPLLRLADLQAWAERYPSETPAAGERA